MKRGGKEDIRGTPGMAPGGLKGWTALIQKKTFDSGYSPRSHLLDPSQDPQPGPGL